MRCGGILIKSWAVAAVFCVSVGPFALGQSNIKVTGRGFFENRHLDGRLAFLNDVEAGEPAELDAALLEDSAFLLMEQVKRDGYLKPRIEGRFEVDGAERRVRWEEVYSIQLEADFVAEHAVFEVLDSVRYYYDTVAIRGVDVISKKALKRYFIPGGVLFQGKGARAFTHRNFERRLGRVIRVLEEMGYRSAQVLESEADVDDATGAVQVSATIDQGPLYRIGAATVEISSADAPVEIRELAAEGVPATSDWGQEQRRRLRNEAYRAGYPDVEIRVETVDERELSAHERALDLRFIVERGETVAVGKVDFEGDAPTKRSVLDRQVDLEEGRLLDYLAVSEGRRKLMGLGIYREVDLRFEPSDGPVRDVVYELTPSQRKELQLLAGWGSYEQARVGFNWEHRNPWGRAQRYEIGAKQSFKATEGTAVYTVPQFLGTDLTVYADAEYSTREELSYDQVNKSVAIGTSTFLSGPGIRLTAEYEFSQQEAERRNDSDFETEVDALVASLNFRVSFDRRDNVLVPTSGYNLFAGYEFASEWLGGSVNFHKFELGGTYHFSLTESTIVHLGLRYGTIFSTGDSEENIPFTERFFWGGENSVRGYREGEASPLDSSGDPIGAEVYLLGNIEVEQRLMERLSAVVFLDVVANARDGFFEDAGDVLYSVGLGVRYNTAVGPIRLEYGYNPEPRASDPNGSLHFSIGFPF